MRGPTRLRKDGIHHVTRFHDASNAFYCTHKSRAEEAADALALESRVDLFCRRILNSVLRLMLEFAMDI
eukprot:1312459-Pyramimonas_sp.AAC.1